MSYQDIKVNFKTITPLWTGDAWGQNTAIRPSSILGSMRFWFEVLCYFAKVTNSSNYENGKLKDKLNLDDFHKATRNHGSDFEGVSKALEELKISWPSRVFGCTGWKGWIGIKRIEIESGKFNNQLRGIILQGRRNNWYWASPYYEGELSVVFDVEEAILDGIFYPLLNFIEKYGLLGGKWNIGYGRVEVLKIEQKEEKIWKEVQDWRPDLSKGDNSEGEEEKFTLSLPGSSEVKDVLIKIKELKGSKIQSYTLLAYFLGIDNFYCRNEKEFERKTHELPKEIIIIKNIAEASSNEAQSDSPKSNDTGQDFQTIIKELLQKKAEMRDCLRTRNRDKSLWDNFRHILFGTTKAPPKNQVPQGTKILPWIYKEGERFKGGFISIAGLLNIKEKNGQKD